MPTPNQTGYRESFRGEWLASLVLTAAILLPAGLEDRANRLAAEAARNAGHPAATSGRPDNSAVTNQLPGDATGGGQRTGITGKRLDIPDKPIEIFGKFSEIDFQPPDTERRGLTLRYLYGDSQPVGGVFMVIPEELDGKTPYDNERTLMLPVFLACINGSLRDISTGYPGESFTAPGVCVQKLSADQARDLPSPTALFAPYYHE